MRLAVLCALLCLAAPIARAAEPVLDLSTLPRMNPGGRESYEKRFLLGNLPRAWAIASSGAYGGVWGAKSVEIAIEGALKSCQTKGGTDCAIYAEGLDLVWKGRPKPATAPETPIAEAQGYAIIPDARFFRRGPAAARGLFVWGHGFNAPDVDVRGGQPPASLRAFNNAGWDIARFDRAPSFDANAERVTAWLHTALVDLRAKGWRRIGVGGQSRGGWNALEMLRFPGTAEVVIAHSPGPGTGTIPGIQATKGQTMLWSLTDEIPPSAARLAYVQFAEDPFGGDKDQRAARLRATLPGKLGALLLIDQPEGFKGHFAGGTPAFAERYGPCLLRFAEDTPPGAC